MFSYGGAGEYVCREAFGQIEFGRIEFGLGARRGFCETEFDPPLFCILFGRMGESERSLLQNSCLN